MWKTPIKEKNHGRQGRREKIHYVKNCYNHFVFSSYPKPK